MALNFPDNPSLNDTYVDSTSGFTYVWNGTVWISTVDRKIGNIKQIDDISASFDGSETVFTIYSNGQVIAPLETNKTIISVGGVLQNPGDDYSVFGTQITFSTAPTNGLTFFGQVLQTDQSKSTLADRSVGPEGLSTGGFAWNSSGDFIVSGILTSGTSSITIDGSANEITVGTAATINESGITAGIVTGTFYGDGANLDGVSGTIGATESVNTSGIITASSFTGDGRNLTDVGGYLAGLIYSPGIGNTEAATDTGIAITFTKSIEKNSGVINLRENSISGTIAESYDIATVGSSSTIAISGAKLTITPNTTLGTGTTYFVEVPANTVRDTYDTGGNLGITSFTFVTTPEVATGGTLFGWGRNNSGNLGLGDESNRSSPAQVPGTDWISVSGGNGKTLFRNSSNELYGTGPASNIGVNQSTGIKYSSPKQIPGTQWSDMSSGNYSAMGLKTDGTLWSWSASNSDGQLGQNDRIARSSPTQIPGTQWSKVSLVRHGTVATKTDGTLWTWGFIRGGQNTSGYRSSPAQVPGTQWDSVFAVYDGWWATKTDGTLWACGLNNNGDLGINDEIPRSSPIQLPGTGWNKVSNVWGGRPVLATKTDGTLWTWGGGGSGMNGLNDTVSRSSPTQIPGSGWSNPSSGYDVSLATKTDGTLWVWGYGTYGLGGQNGGAIFPVNGYRSSPIQVPGTNWHRNQMKVAFQSAFAFKTS